MIENIPNVNINKAQILAILGSVVFFFFILIQVKSKKIKEEYSLLWLFFSVLFVIFSFWRDGLTLVARVMGIAYPPAALFLLLIVAELFILIQFSILISKHSEGNKNLAQEQALLKLELEKLKKELEDLKK